MRKSIFCLSIVLGAIVEYGTQDQQVLIDFVNTIKVEKPLVYKNLTVYPLSSDRYHTFPKFLTLDQAIGQGFLVITEIGPGEVNRISVENRSKKYVFLMAGELLTGCKQDRMVADDCLLPPQSGKVELTVYCIEHGRWIEQSRNFHSPKASAHIRMRRVAKESDSQQRVWEEVRSKATRLSVTPTPTEALQSVLSDKEVASRCLPYMKHFDQILAFGPNVVGVAVASGREIICIDIFASPPLFKVLWPKLLQSYILDVIDRPKVICRIERRDVEFILDGIFNANFRPSKTDGVGTAWTISGFGISGSALVHRSSVVHCDLFPSQLVNSDDCETLRMDYRRWITR